jgi:phosphatidylglycerol:prolipoprotein diacylglycerol transferase
MRTEIVSWLQHAGVGWLAVPLAAKGLMDAVAAMVAVALFLWRARGAGWRLSIAVDVALFGVVFALLGARLAYLILDPSAGHAGTGPLFSMDGTTSWGAYAGASAGLLIAARWTREPPWRWLDLAASTAPLATVMGRIECWLQGDDFGKITNVPWAVRFPAGSPAWQVQVSRGELPPNATASLPVHPLQLYLIVNALLLFALMSYVWRAKRDDPGWTYGSWCLAYGITRFGWEFFRDPAEWGAAHGLSIEQWLCLALVATGVIVMLRRPRVST